MSNFERVRAFHDAVNAHHPRTPATPNAARVALRRTLIQEEYAEVQAELDRVEACIHTGSPADLAPLAHELADLLYVTYGALDALGVNADAVFAEVHRANMHKTTGPKRADGKQLKPAGWTPANVRGVLSGEGRVHHAKLVRDGIPARLQRQGLTAHVEVLDDDAYRAALREKLAEEAREAQQASSEALAEELADLLEVAHALMRAENLTRADVDAARTRKRAERGAFDARLKLLWTE